MKYLKKIIREAAKREITLTQLADSANITVDVLKKAMKNDELSVHQLNNICLRLGVCIGDIFVLEHPCETKMLANFHFLSNKVFC